MERQQDCNAVETEQALQRPNAAGLCAPSCILQHLLSVVGTGESPLLVAPVALLVVAAALLLFPCVCSAGGSGGAAAGVCEEDGGHPVRPISSEQPPSRDRRLLRSRRDGRENDARRVPAACGVSGGGDSSSVSAWLDKVHCSLRNRDA